MQTTRLSLVLLAVTVLFTTSHSLQAASPSEVRVESAHLFGKASALKGLIHAHYRNSYSFRRLDSTAHAFYGLTRHMSERARRAGHDRADLRHDLRQAEEMFASLEHLAYAAEHDLRRQHGGRFGMARHIRRLLHDADACLDELEDLLRAEDVAALPRYRR